MHVGYQRYNYLISSVTYHLADSMTLVPVKIAGTGTGEISTLNQVLKFRPKLDRIVYERPPRDKQTLDSQWGNGFILMDATVFCGRVSLLICLM